VTDDFLSTLREIVERLDRLGIPYMLVGSMAALAHGRVRTTQDFDLVIDVDESRLRTLVKAFPEERFYVSEEAATDALRLQSLFNVIDMETGWKIDLIPRKRRPFSLEEFSRRQRLSLLGLDVAVASVEDTIISKLEWAKLGGSSARQLEDVRELRGIAGDRLDLAYIERWVRELGLESEWQATDQ
jgi:Nucleotidyltransferase of unknown function (DUF6036)